MTLTQRQPLTLGACAPRNSRLPLYLGGAGLSLFGNAAIAIVLPWLVISRTGDPSARPSSRPRPHRVAFPRPLRAGGRPTVVHRNVAVAADVGSALSVAAIAVVDATFGLSLSWFVALGVAGAIFDVPGMTARQALLADVSTTSGVQVDKVAGGFQTMFGVAFLAGPGIAGFLMTVLEPIDVVWMTAACSAAAALATLCMRLIDEVPAPRRTRCSSAAGRRSGAAAPSGRCWSSRSRRRS